MRTVWNRRNRELLESLLHEYYPVTTISKMMGIGAVAIYREIRKTISEEEYNNKQYGKYTAAAAIDAEIRELQRK